MLFVANLLKKLTLNAVILVFVHFQKDGVRMLLGNVTTVKPLCAYRRFTQNSLLNEHKLEAMQAPYNILITYY